VPVAGPWITEREVRYVADAAASDWYGQAGRYLGRFERAMADHCQRRFACALPSCTAGLHLALAAAGIGPGDEVIVPDVTWIASVAPVRYLGATAVMADMAADSWCLTAASIQACITPRTKAIIVVDLYGQMPDMDEIVALAAQHGITLIEDSAEAVGATYKGQPAGSFGRASCFSFHGSKTVTTGEGGMLLTDDKAFFDRVMVLRDHGGCPATAISSTVKWRISIKCRPCRQPSGWPRSSALARSSPASERSSPGTSVGLRACPNSCSIPRCPM